MLVQQRSKRRIIHFKQLVNISGISCSQVTDSQVTFKSVNVKFYPASSCKLDSAGWWPSEWSVERDAIVVRDTRVDYGEFLQFVAIGCDNEIKCVATVMRCDVSVLTQTVVSQHIIHVMLLGHTVRWNVNMDIKVA